MVCDNDGLRIASRKGQEFTGNILFVTMETLKGKGLSFFLRGFATRAIAKGKAKVWLIVQVGRGFWTNLLSKISKNLG